MSNPPESPERFSLSRWSRRKHEVAREKADPVATPASPATATAAAPVVAPAPVPAEPPLPPVESLTIDSDFRAFMGPKVDEDTKRAALKKLFSDPHFNIMDGLDIYIGDYSQADPMPEGMLAKIADVYGKLTEEGAAEVESEGAAAAAAEGTASLAAVEESPPPTAAQEESPSDAAAEEDHDRRG